MLYKGYAIEVWKSEWVGKVVEGQYYSASTFFYHDRRTSGQEYKYIVRVCKINSGRGFEIWGGSTPKIALDLARFSIDLHIVNHRRWDMQKRWKESNIKYLRNYYAKLSGNT